MVFFSFFFSFGEAEDWWISRVAPSSAVRCSMEMNLPDVRSGVSETETSWIPFTNCQGARPGRQGRLDDVIRLKRRNGEKKEPKAKVHAALRLGAEGGAKRFK